MTLAPPRAAAEDGYFRGLHNFPKHFYAEALKLKIGEISAPILRDKAIHLFELMDRKTYGSAPASYKQHLTSRLRRENELFFLSSQLEALKKTSEIHILTTKRSEALTK